MALPEKNPEALVIRKDNGPVRHLVINRPSSYNALSIACMEALIEEFEALSEERSVGVAILSGAGKGFCAGHDLKEMRGNPEREFYEKTFETCTRMMLSIVDCPKPVIAKVHGVASAAGCQLVATCDLAVADEGARFSTPGVNIGLFCSTPMVALSRNVSRKHAMEMLLTGDFVTAQRAYEMGLVNRVAAAGELDAAAIDFASKIASKSPLTLKTGKKAFYEQIDKDLRGAYEYASRVMVENMMARDAEEGIDAFIEKREPRWCGE